MIDSAYFNVLRQIHAWLSNTVSNTDVNWVVTGSLGFALQGISVQPNDIDLQTDKVGAYKIESLFSDVVIRQVKFSTTEQIRSYFGALQIDGIEVEIMGNIQKRGVDGVWEEPINPGHYRRRVEIAGLLVPVLSLEYEYQAYLKLGKIEKTKVLRDWSPDDDLAAHLSALYLKHRFADIQLFDDVLPALNVLQGHYMMGLLSNGKTYPGRCGLAGYFQFVVLAQDYTASKNPIRGFSRLLSDVQVARNASCYM